MWHESPGSSVVPWQSWVALNGAATAPPKPDITTAAEPTLVIVTCCVGADVLTCTSPNDRPTGVTRNCSDGVSRGLEPVSAMLNDCPFQLPELVAAKLPAVVGW